MTLSAPASAQPSAPATPRAGLRTIPHRFAVIMAAEGDRARAQRDAVLAFFVRCVSAGLLYLTQIVFARWMGGFEYGIYVSVWTWVLILGGLSHFGMSLASIRLVPAYTETGRLDRVAGIIKGSRMVALAGGTTIALLGMAGLYVFGSAISNDYLRPLYLALVCIPLYALTDVQDGIGRGKAWIATALLPPYVLRPALLLIVMSGSYLAGLPMEATTACGAAIASTWLAGIVQAIAINVRLPADVRAANPSYDFRSWFKLSFPVLLMAACEMAMQNADVLILSRYMDPKDVGIYFAAGKTMALVMFVHYAVGSAVANRFAALHARGDREALKAFVRDAVHWTFWPSLFGAAVILAAGKPLLWLFGPQFQAGYPVMFILVIGFLFRASVGPAEYLLNMLGEQALCAAVLVVSAVLNIALNFALVPVYGLIGAATATSISLSTAALLNYVVVWRRLDIEIAIWKNLPRR